MTAGWASHDGYVSQGANVRRRPFSAPERGNQASRNSQPIARLVITLPKVSVKQSSKSCGSPSWIIRSPAFTADGDLRWIEEGTNL